LESERRSPASWDRGDARSAWHALAPLVAALASEPNPAPVKAALARLGLIRDGLRAPMTGASDALRRRLEALPLA